MKKQYTTLYIVRHGRTDWNVAGRVQGHTDIPLNAEGEAQARNLAERLKHLHFDAVFSSDLMRAKRTAEIIVLEKKLAIKTTEALREQTYGRFEGKLGVELDEQLKQLLENYQNVTVQQRMQYRGDPTMETHEEVVSRFTTFLREVAVAYHGKTILIATHGAVMRYFLIHLGFGNYESLPPRSIKNTAYLKVESDGVDFFIKETEGVHKVE